MTSRADLSAFGERWNKKVKTDVAFAPDDAELAQGVVSTGLETVDHMLGGGFARGRTSMLYGAESAGKTLLLQFTMAAVQRAGGRCLYFDIERTYTPQWFELTGVSLAKDKLLIMRPKTMEQAFDMICEALDKLGPDILVVDSLPALVPQAMMEANMEDKDFMGLSARKTTEGVKKATQYNRSTAFVVVNQLRAKIGASPHERPDMFPGGKALRHALTQIVFMRRGDWLTVASEEAQGDDLEQAVARLEEPVTYNARTGFKMKMRVEKNKYDVPWKETDVDVFFTGVVDEISALVGTFVHQGIIKANRGFYEVPGIDGKVHGWEKLEALIREDEVLRGILRGQLR